MGATPHAFCPGQPLCASCIGSKFEPKALFCLQVSCNCLPGYSGDGVSKCNPINLCEQVWLQLLCLVLVCMEPSRGEVFPSPRS